ncbi:Galactose-1-phosphate uridylyltransferase [Periweissella ghanensis]|uniref:Galactose-1-phosphate uridylyltransferase n=2 Tax=Periweissella ghanensis TaxID=467997 RepID=A0ABM8Z9B1_9LACO|nr:UDP-glucose--hexose-1-phosphate uridylyltransferase [Periweissella ghanensis]CAH0418064.1 Galactose-1-phosphate uridylyltransferase [Periweissella ghanensis]
MMSTSSLVKGLAHALVAASDCTAADEIYLTNQILAQIKQTDFDNQAAVATGDLLELMDQVVAVGLKNYEAHDEATNADMLGANLMNLVLPLPSIVNQQFWQQYKLNPRTATDAFYQQSRRVNYIKTREIARNIEFPYASDYVNLQITINLSKPEKDPKAIAAAQKVKSNSYPVCQLCLENEGYAGRLNYPARANHRVIGLTLGDEPWYFQYSPYAYYNEHAIVFAKEHRPMVVSGANIRRLFEFVTLFPDYFIGSNADLPIVGGSILTHDHFQAGRYLMPMAQAPIETAIEIPGIALHAAGIVKWPMSVIRLQDADYGKLVQASELILTRWQQFDYQSQNIVAYTNDGVRHHTVTPIARMHDGLYEIDLVLRDNNTSVQYPDGIFHPHQDVQHIKQENIGLIEVMGLAILPPRLVSEMAAVKAYLLNTSTEVNPIHQAWADELKAQNHHITANNVDTIINQAIGATFERVLTDAGVFKRTPIGRTAFKAFIASLA